MAHEGGRNAPVSRLLLCVGLFLDTAENVRQRIRCRRIAGTDEPGVNVRGGAGLCVAQSARNRCNRHMSRYQQAGVGVAQAVEVNRREIMGGQKARKPARNRIGVERLTVPAGEQHILKRDLWKESVILSQRQRVRTEPIIVHPLQDIAGIDIICDDKPSFTKQRDLFIIALERFCLVCCWHGFTSNVL